ncbi:MAG TPA: polysaccharide deacetylase family protein [Candidatus Atribacteria bacterium]|jgi:peptidoglycan/xylan/chitin deacetylase (PgdA/CDA1 family)|nr:polysaccharide deacetylase family protein [Atribacterota bacterium]HOA99489.1 polysaccharide deacetylase family protein [Candidatus Atribacteria bacterium]HOQ51284.1 polysaccharide deacetylase family protein [Candidatus Atribacteria bacterium]HPT63983.1 polysaccharide deacetylase family protein [Candidatus Atribacteria bacterium]HPZ39879.1 polysaccharide deacetylase family protein [Candidatus Atribacteria bacterium]
MRKLKILVWISCLILLILFLQEEAISIETEEDIFGLNLVRSLGGNSQVRKEVALTFDDAPSPFTKEVLKILDNYGVSATFFLVGSQVEKSPEVARQIVAAGHEIGNHSFSHCWSSDDSVETLVEDIKRAEEAIYRATGQVPLYFRPPGGMVNDKVKEACGQTGYGILLWWVDSRDWLLTEEEILEKVKKEVKDGAIILFHNLATTVEVLPQVIEDLRREGYKFVTISQLLRY